jgi:DNA helicase II / ATP-dependent DNA helicase PcrA
MVKKNATKIGSIELNKEQKQAVNHKNGPLLIVAGAGTGKTKVITERILSLFGKKDIAPENVLALTFTDKAAGEMVERIEKELPIGYVDLWVMTFHSFAQKLLEAHGADIGLPTKFKLLDETSTWLLVRDNFNSFDLDYYRPLGKPTSFIHAMVKHFSRCKDELITTKQYLDYAESLRTAENKDEDGLLEEAQRVTELANAYHRYQQILVDNSCLDFGDLVFYAYQLLEKRPDIRKKYQQQFKHVLVDEFQDTNYGQYQLIKLLLNDEKNITVVGDDDQSIYKFRGASVSNILQFKKDFPEATDVVLTTNYRSRQIILDTAYEFIQNNNPDRLEIALGGSISKRLQAATTGPGVIEYLSSPSAETEADAVAEKIIALDEGKNSWNNFAVLARSNDALRPIIEALEKQGIPFQYVASRGLFGKPLVLDLIAFLRLLDNVHESDALFRFLSLPVFELAPLDVIEISRLASRKQLTLFEATRDARQHLPTLSDATFAKLERALSLLSLGMKRAPTGEHKSVSRVVFEFLKESGYLKYIETLPDLKRAQNFFVLEQFYRRLQGFELTNDDHSVRAYLRLLELEIEAGEQGALETLAEEGPELVKVMTIHASKGLEFKHVFVVSMVDRRFPSTQRSEPIELPDALVKEFLPSGNAHLQEERRLCYVAITRAKEGLYLSGAKSYGGSRDKKPSVFVEEMGIKPIDVPAKKLDFAQSDKAEIDAYWKPLIPKRFSFTQLQDFIRCPRYYYYKYIVKLPMIGNHHLSFGNTIHLTLQRYAEEKARRVSQLQMSLFGNQEKKSADISEEELLELYKVSWQDDWYESKEQKEKYRAKGRKMLLDWQQSEFTISQPPLFIEKPFTIKVDDAIVTGKIDRIDALADGTVAIVDYKTGRPKDKLDAEDKRQLLVYQLAVEQVFKLPVSWLAYHYLDNGACDPFIGDKKDIEKIITYLSETITDIREFNFADYLERHQSCDQCRDII